MTPAEAIKRAEGGDLLPVWLLSGEERLLRDQALAAITKAALDGAQAPVLAYCRSGARCTNLFGLVQQMKG